MHEQEKELNSKAEEISHLTNSKSENSDEQQQIFEEKLDEERRKIVNDCTERISLIEKESHEAKERARIELRTEYDKQLKELNEKFNKEREELQIRLLKVKY